MLDRMHGLAAGRHHDVYGRLAELSVPERVVRLLEVRRLRELDAGRIENMIGRHPVDRKRMAIVEKNGKFAVTNWRVLGHSNETGLSAVECRIETGRTHQIRVHMASLRCPVAGDRTYGSQSRDKRLEPVPERQMLHAWRLSLRHPVTHEEMSFEAPIPADMRRYLGGCVGFSPSFQRGAATFASVGSSADCQTL